GGDGGVVMKGHPFLDYECLLGPVVIGFHALRQVWLDGPVVGVAHGGCVECEVPCDVDVVRGIVCVQGVAGPTTRHPDGQVTALAWFPVARAAGTRLPAAGCKDRGDDGTGDGGLEEGPAAGVEATVRGGLGQGGHGAPLWYGDRTRSTRWGGSYGGR